MLNIFLCACWPFVYLLWRHVYSSPLSIYLKVGRKFLLLSLGISSKRLFYRALVHVLVRVSREAEQTGDVERGVYLYAWICLFLFFIEVQLFAMLYWFLLYNKVNRHIYTYIWTSLVAQMVKHLPAMWETWVRSLGWEDPLEKEKATHSSTLAWKSPWTEEPGRLQFMGLQRVGHDWEPSLLHTYICSILDPPPILLSHPSGSSQNTELSSLFYTVCSH